MRETIFHRNFQAIRLHALQRFEGMVPIKAHFSQTSDGFLAGLEWRSRGTYPTGGGARSSCGAATDTTKYPPDGVTDGIVQRLRAPRAACPVAHLIDRALLGRKLKTNHHIHQKSQGRMDDVGRCRGKTVILPHLESDTASAGVQRSAETTQVEPSLAFCPQKLVHFVWSHLTKDTPSWRVTVNYRLGAKATQ